MLRLSRLLIIMAVAFIAARPMMACCLTGHVEPAAHQMQSGGTDCHTKKDDMGHHAAHTQVMNQPSEPPLKDDCSGCFDCDVTIFQTNSLEGGSLLTNAPSEIQLANITARFDGFERASIIFKTGPPGGPPPTAHSTPISLKQRLLI